MLLRYLGAQREHVLGILEGLDEAARRRPLLPSGGSCLGLVQRLALDVERFWFQAVVAGEQGAIDALADTPNAWQLGPDASASASTATNSGNADEAAEAVRVSIVTASVTATSCQSCVVSRGNRVLTLLGSRDNIALTSGSHDSRRTTILRHPRRADPA